MMKYLYGAMALSAMLNLTPAAEAEVVHLPASSCQALSGTATIDSSGRLWNKSTTTVLTVLCPLPLPYEPNANADVFAIDQNTSSNITCTPYTFNSGGARVPGTADSSSGYGNTSQHLELAGPTYNYSFTSRFLICSIPVTQNGLSSSLLLYTGEVF